ncbi:hypothetical protein ACFV1C_00380 [Streptomyces sp. NPDC059605]|uniref:hypothetical protein n=1 Tax=Streptomyces sp. NPDC059605 TaxID=3346882 RepID=UPI0036926E8D
MNTHTGPAAQHLADAIDVGCTRDDEHDHIADHRTEVLNEAADFIDRDDTCDCGGCESCVLRTYAAELRRMANGDRPAPAETPLIVSRYDVEMEPAIEEDPVLTIGAIADDGRPVALLLDPENRTKVGRWITPTTDNTENYTGELAMLRGLVATIRATATHGSNMDEVRRLLAEHAADEQDAYTGGTK